MLSVSVLIEKSLFHFVATTTKVEEAQVAIMATTPHSSKSSAAGLTKSVKTLISHKGAPIIIPNGGYGWVVVGAAFCVEFFILGTVNGSGIYMPVYIKEFNANPGTVAWVGSIGKQDFIIKTFLYPCTILLTN